MKRSREHSVREPARYLGNFDRVLDNLRFILPQEWRPKGSPKDFAIILWPVIDYNRLLVLPPEAWADLQTKFHTTRLADESAQAVHRLFSTHTRERTLDSWGRLALPEELANPLGIRDSVMLCGGMNRFEIWHPYKLAEVQKSINPQEIKNKIESLNI